MTLTCVWHDHDLQRLSLVEPYIAHGIADAFRYLNWWRIGKEEGYVLRVYNSAVSFWFGFDDSGDLIVANSKAEFLHTRKLKNDLIKGGQDM